MTLHHSRPSLSSLCWLLLLSSITACAADESKGEILDDKSAQADAGVDAGNGNSSSAGDAGALDPKDGGSGGADAGTQHGGSEAGQVATGAASSDAGLADASAPADAAVDAGPHPGPSAGGLLVLPLEGPTAINPPPIVLTEDNVTDLPPTRFQQVHVCDDGSVLGYAQGSVTKVSADGAVEWRRSAGVNFLLNTTLSTVQAVAFTPECETLLGGGTNAGLPGQTYVAAGDAFVLRLDSAGEVVWTHQWGSSSTESVSGIAVSEDGSFFTTGRCDGQVPGSAVALRGYPFVERFDAAGTSLSLLQHAPHVDGTLVSPSVLRPWGGGFYQTGTLGSAAIATFSTDGVPETFAPLIVQRTFSSPLSGMNETFPVKLAPLRGSGYHAESDSFFGLATLDSSDLNSLSSRGDQGLPTGSGLAQFNIEGKLDWLRVAAEAEAVLDPVEGTTWTGRFNGLDDILVTDDAVYIVGKYVNTYMNGSVTPPNTAPQFVGRYDLEGNREWFTQVLIAQEPPTASQSPFEIAPPFINAAGNLTLYMHATNGGWYAAEFDTASGEVL